MGGADVDFGLLGPLFAVTCGVLLVVAVDLILPAGRVRPWWFAAALGAVAAAALLVWDLRPLSLATATSVSPAGHPAPTLGAATLSAMWIVDGLTRAVQGAVLLAALLALLQSVLRGERDLSGYLTLLLLAALGMLVLAGAGSLMVMFLGLELLSLSLYVLVGFQRARPAAQEAALKYFILGSVASGFLLFGFALLYGAAGGTALGDLAAHAGAAAARGESAGALFHAGLALAVVGFGFKLALVPFHLWAPDAYQAAPTPITAFMSVGTKAAAFAALVRLLWVSVPAGREAVFFAPLSLLAAGSMLVGSLAALGQEDLKRLLAYSGIAHGGYLLMALPGLGNPGLATGVFYLWAYAFVNLGAFGVLALLEAEGVPGRLEAYQGLFYRRPLLAGALILFLLGLAGLPPTGGFTGKLFLLMSAVQGGAWLLVVCLVLSTGISAYAYLRVVGALFYRKEPAGPRHLAGPAALPPIAGAQEPPLASGPAPAAPVGWAGRLAKAALLVAAWGTLQLGVTPQWALDLVQGLLPLR